MRLETDYLIPGHHPKAIHISTSLYVFKALMDLNGIHGTWGINFVFSSVPHELWCSIAFMFYLNSC